MEFISKWIKYIPNDFINRNKEKGIIDDVLYFIGDNPKEEISFKAVEIITLLYQIRSINTKNIDEIKFEIDLKLFFDFELIKISEEDFAKQLTFIDYFYFLRDIQVDDIIFYIKNNITNDNNNNNNNNNNNLNNLNINNNLNNNINNINNNLNNNKIIPTSIRRCFIHHINFSQWIVKQMLLSNRKEIQIKIFEWILKVLCCLFELNNFHSFITIFHAIHSMSIKRLPLWKLVCYFVFYLFFIYFNYNLIIIYYY